jgi:glycosyltransferase involved in cell wall biosynthesis
MSLPRISIVVPTRDRIALIRRLLDALDRQDEASRPFELVVADDGSRDGTAGFLESRSGKRSFPIRVLRLPRRGPAAARNAAIARARARRILLLGDDTFPTSSAVGIHAAARDGLQGLIEWHPQESVTPVMKFLAPAGPQFYFAGLEHGRPVPYTAVLGSNFSAPAHWFREEPFDENFVFAAFEDTELAYRWSLRGWTTLFDEQATCWHSHRYADLAPFLSRQRRAGQAARYAVEKHPGLILRTILQPLAVGVVKVVRSGIQGRGRPEDAWDRRSRVAFLRGWLEGRGKSR